MIGFSSALPQAWVVKCQKCSCTINCRAIDPQTEHSHPEQADPAPKDHLIVTCSCCWSAFRYRPSDIFKGSPSPSNTCPERRRVEIPRNDSAEKKPNTAVLVAASFIAAVRLNREEIRPSPSVTAKIADSIRLAEMIQERLQRR